MIRKVLLTASLLAATWVTQAAPVLNEGFDNISTLAGSGWTATNNSTAGGTTSWFQGNDGVFGSASGASNSYIAANFLNTGFGGDISNWLITPTLDLSYQSILSFATRSVGGIEGYPDRLEVRLSVNGASADVGATTTSVGDFSTLLAVINPTLADGGGYPIDWMTFSLSLGSIAPGTTGRLAFRYFVTDTSFNGDYIGIDNVSVSVSVPEPSMIALFVTALLALVWVTRRRLLVRA